MRVIVSGGGTGGHIYPALAIADGLQKAVKDVKILYVGTSAGMEAGLVPACGLDFCGIDGKGLPRKMSLEVFKTFAVSTKAFWETKRIIKDFRPDLVVGTGGYVSGPVVFTAALFGIPAVLHEQNAFPGKTNKWLVKFVKAVLVTFEESKPYFKVKDEKIIVTGLPVRPVIGSISKKEGAAKFGLDPWKKTLLVSGGSRGALSINKAVLDILPKLAGESGVQLIWATGTATYQEIIAELEQRKIDWQRSNWRIVEYLQDMPEALACADLCVGRAGAATLAELAAAGKPGILIPYPHAAENHQEYNAMAMAEKGAARVILDRELDGKVLWLQISNILFNSFMLESMGQRAKETFPKDALQRIVEICEQTAWR